MWKWIRNRLTAWTQPVVGQAKISDIMALPVLEARPLAEEALRDPSRYRVTAARHESDADGLRQLAPLVRGLFQRWDRIEPVMGEACLLRGEIGPSQIAPGFIVIGHSIEHTQIVVRPFEETVYQIDGCEPPDDLTSDSYPSVYHWLLVDNELLYGDRNG